MKKNIAIFLSLLFLTFQSAKADVAIGLTAAAHSLDASGTETTRTSNEKNVGGNTEDVLVPEIFVEATADNGVSIGLAYIPTRELGNKSRSDTNSEGDTGTYTAKAELDNVVQIYLDYPVSEYNGATVYVKGGIQHATITTLESLNSGSTYPNKDVLGYTVGLGAKGDLPYANTFYKFDLTYTDFEDYSADSSAGNKVEAELEDIAAKLSIGYRF
mgnify:CR=1 FL=1